ncbi:MAG: M48 family metallopeptidase [Marinicaulis sp.]|nr:M48 family metallopeptidase [Marinicaulis sp.]
MAAQKFFSTHIDVNGRPVRLKARVNRRAKRLILKVDPIIGEILATAPSQRTLGDAVKFAKESTQWIAKELNKGLAAIPFGEGTSIPLRGVKHEIIQKGGPRTPVRICSLGDQPMIEVGGAAEHINRRVTEWLKRQARADLEQHVVRFCAQLQKPESKIRIRDTRTRWASCSSDGVLCFSWRLILTPPEIMEYVVAHECAHLVHMNHSPAFWRQVAALGVNARAAESWFNANGAKLFSYGVNP